MKNISFLILFSLMLGACKTGQKVSSDSDAVVFTIQKTSCYGQCPVYSMEVFASGKLTYEGVEHVDKIGKYHKTIDKTEVDQLIADFESANFFGFEDEYTARITDLPTTYTSFTHNGTTKKITDYHGAPRELKDLEKKLHDIAQSDNWTKE